MTNLSPADFREVRNNPGALAPCAQTIASARDTESARLLDSLVNRSLASLILDRRWTDLQAFNTSLLHSLRSFERAAHAGWPEGLEIAAGWKTLLRLGGACLAMARDERAVDFAESTQIHGDILRALERREPMPSGDLAAAVGKSRQRVSNVLGDMEEHGLISRHGVGKRTLVWLGPAGHYYLQHMSGAARREVAPKREFDERYADDAGRHGAGEENPLRRFRGLQGPYAAHVAE